MKVLIKDGQIVAEADDALKQTAQFQAIESDTQRYSITPTTFDTRTYDADLDCWYFEDLYQHKDNHATRFGLNDRSTILRKVLDSECKTFDVTTKPPSTTKSTKYTPAEAKAIKLCSLEQELIDMAIRHLVKSGDKAVVVDILARMNGGSENGYVKIERDIPEIHSVVLYINPQAMAGSESSSSTNTEKVVSVIDPSNFLFSSHLSNHQTSSVDGVNCVITTLHSGRQIYKPQVTPPGPGKDQYRDCIDAAVKMAFGFNFSDLYQNLGDLKSSVLNCEVIRKISNMLKIDSSVLSENLPTRVKQTSDLALVESYNKLQRIVKKNKDLVSSIVDDTRSIQLEDECTSILKTSDSYVEIRDRLCSYNLKCIGEVNDALKTEHSDLLGELV